MIGVVGGGVVGRATARGLIEYVDDVAVYDIDSRRATGGWVDAAQADIVFLCLPTPLDNGRLNTQALTDWLALYIDRCGTDNEFLRKHEQRSIVVRSTVPVGTTARLNQVLLSYGLEQVIVHNPEFLTARCAVTDYQLPARHILGADGRAETAADRVAALYRQRFPGTPILRMGSHASELTKLGQNSFAGWQLTWWNLLERCCRESDIDFEEVRAGILSDGRFAASHTKVPGPDGRRGFGGACLPKDSAELAAAIRDCTRIDLLQQALAVNDQLREEG